MAMVARILATVPTPEPPWPIPTSAQPGQSVPRGERTGRRPQKNAGLVQNSINTKCQLNWEGVSRENLFF